MRAVRLTKYTRHFENGTFWVISWGHRDIQRKNGTVPVKLARLVTLCVLTYFGNEDNIYV